MRTCTTLLLLVALSVLTGCSHAWHGAWQDANGYTGYMTDQSSPDHYRALERDTEQQMTVIERHASILELLRGKKK